MSTRENLIGQTVVWDTYKIPAHLVGLIEYGTDTEGFCELTLVDREDVESFLASLPNGGSFSWGAEEFAPDNDVNSDENLTVVCAQYIVEFDNISPEEQENYVDMYETRPISQDAIAISHREENGYEYEVLKFSSNQWYYSIDDEPYRWGDVDRNDFVATEDEADALARDDIAFNYCVEEGWDEDWDEE